MFALAHVAGPLTDEQSKEMASLVASLLEEHGRKRALEAVNPTGGASWVIDNTPDKEDGPVVIDMIGARDFEAHIRIGPTIEDGLFLHCMRKLVDLFANLEGEKDPADPTLRRHRTARSPIPRRRKDH